MSRIAITIVAAFLAVGISACSRTLHLELRDGTPVQLVTFPPSATVIQPREVSLEPQTPAYRHLQDWVARNQRGWYQSFAASPGGGIVVHAGDLTLHFVDGAVFTSTARGQFQKELPEEDYAFLKKPAGI